MNNDLVFRRINGRIIPIKKSSLKIKKDDYKGASQIGAGAAISAASGIYAAKAIRKANFFFGRSANLRGISTLASKGSVTRTNLIRQSAVSKIAAKGFARKGFGALLIGTTVAAGLASIGTARILNKRTSEDKKIGAVGIAGSVVSGIGFAYFGKKVKLGQIAKLVKVANPKKTVSEAFSIYSSQGMKRSFNTIKKFKLSSFSEAKTLARQNKQAAQSVYNAKQFGGLVKSKRSFSKKIDPNQGTLF